MNLGNSDPIEDSRIGSLHLRLKEVIGNQSVRSFALEIGVSETAVRKYLKGGLPALDILVRICDYTGVNVSWLATGDGPKYPTKLEKQSNKLRSKIKASINSGSDSETAFDLWEKQLSRELNDDEEALLESLLDAKLSIHKRFVEYFDLCSAKEVTDTDVENFNSEFALIDGEHLTLGEPDEEWDENNVRKQFAFRHKWLEWRGLDAENLKLFFVKGDSMSGCISGGDTVMVDCRDNAASDGVFAIKFEETTSIRRLLQNIDGSMEVIADNEQYPNHHVSKEDKGKISILGRIVWIGKDFR